MRDETEELRPIRTEAMERGERLGLPRPWLEQLPRIEELPGTYADGHDQLDGDAFLAWKAQEYLVRSNRLGEASPALLAEALEDAAAADGPGWLHDALRRLMFLMAWPHRSYYLKVELDLARDRLRACLEDSPSMHLLISECWARTWLSVRYEIEGLDDRLSLEEACPWSTLDELTAAADERLMAERRLFP